MRVKNIRKAPAGVPCAHQLTPWGPPCGKQSEVKVYCTDGTVYYCCFPCYEALFGLDVHEDHRIAPDLEEAEQMLRYIRV